MGVIGCGRMGRLHTRVSSQLDRVKLIGVFDASSQAAEAAAQQYGTKAFADLDELLSQVTAVLIAVPTVHHLSIALQALKHKVACLIEKPLAPDAVSARKIVETAQRAGVCVQVGHIERFNPAVRAMAALNIRPRFIEVTRISPLTFRSIDVGVVLDMMIHDIDIVLRLASSTVTRIDAVGVSVIGASDENSGLAKSHGPEDICNARLTFANGCVANLTASRLAMKTERKLRVFSPDAYVSLDYQKKHAMVARRGGNLSAIRDAVGRIRSGEITDLSQLNFADLVQIEELAIDDVEPLRAQLDAFVDSVTGLRPTTVSGEDGLLAVETAEQIVAAMNAEQL